MAWPDRGKEEEVVKGRRIPMLILMLCLILMTTSLYPGLVDATSHGAIRYFSDSWVSPGDDLVVTVAARGYGAFGQLIETLPEGFRYKGTSLETGPRVEDLTLSFTLLGDETFTYAVTAPDEEGVYAFSGVLRDSDKDERAVSGNFEVTVSSAPRPTPTPTLTPMPTPSPTPTLAPTPTSTPTSAPTPSPMPTPTFTPTPTSTPRPTPAPTPAPTPTPTPTPMPTPTVTQSPTPTPSPSLSPTPTPTSTPELGAVSVPTPAVETPTPSLSTGAPLQEARPPVDEADAFPSWLLFLFFGLAIAGLAIGLIVFRHRRP